MSAIVGLMKPQQRLVVNEFSQVLVYESSGFDSSKSSEDGQGKVLDRAKDVAVKKMVRSKVRQDRRFINMFRVQYARRHGVEIGFEGLHDKTDQDGPEDPPTPTFRRAKSRLNIYKSLVEEE